MKIKLKLSVSEQRKTVTINLKDYGISAEDWNDLTGTEKESEIQQFVDGMDQPYWDIDLIEEL